MELIAMNRAFSLLTAFYMFFTGCALNQTDLALEDNVDRQSTDMFQQTRDTNIFEWNNYGSYAKLNLKLDLNERIIRLVFIDNENLMIVSSDYLYIYNMKKGEIQKNDIGVTPNNLFYPGAVMETEKLNEDSIFIFKNIFTGKVEKRVELPGKWDWVSPDGDMAVSINNAEKEMLVWDRSKGQSGKTRIDYSEWGGVTPIDIYYLTDHTILYNASSVSALGDNMHFALGICNTDICINSMFEHYGVKIASGSKSTIFACNTNEFLGSDQCKTIYKIIENQPIPTNIPIALNTELSFNGKYILSFDSLPPFYSNAKSNLLKNYIINIYSYDSEELVNSYPLEQNILQGNSLSPDTLAISADGNVAALLYADTSTVLIVHLNLPQYSN